MIKLSAFPLESFQVHNVEREWEINIKERGMNSAELDAMVKRENC